MNDTTDGRQPGNPAAPLLPCQVAYDDNPYHVGFVVQDIRQAMRDLSRTTGLTWNDVHDGTLGDWDYRIVFSRVGPLRTELIEGPPGSPWDPGPGPRCDHLGYWAQDLDAAVRSLDERGCPLDFDARPYGRPFTYHRMPALGLRVELVDVSVRPQFLSRWGAGE